MFLETQEHLKGTTPPSIDASRINAYYLDPVLQIVHVALSVKRFRLDLKQLAHEPLIPAERIKKAIDSLEQLGLVKRDGSGINVTAHDLHLSRDAMEYHAWANQMRLFGMQKAQVVNKESSYAFSVVFSADEDTRKKIQEAFLRFIGEVQGMVKSAAEENVFQMNFDLFRWTHRS